MIFAFATIHLLFIRSSHNPYMDHLLGIDMSLTCPNCWEHAQFSSVAWDHPQPRVRFYFMPLGLSLV